MQSNAYWIVMLSMILSNDFYNFFHARLAAVASLRNWGNSVQTLQVSCFFVRNHAFIFVYTYHNNNYNLINGWLKSLKRKCCNMSEFFWRRKETQALQQLDQLLRKTSQGTVSLGLPCQLNTGAGFFFTGSSAEFAKFEMFNCLLVVPSICDLSAARRRIERVHQVLLRRRG